MIVLAADHAGVGLKAEIIQFLASRDEGYRDLGPFDERSVDYPEYAHRLVRELEAGRAERGILICGTGIGMSMAANRHLGVRAALCHDAYTAEMARRHNNANLLCIGARVTGGGVAMQLVALFLDTPFEGGRHERRVSKIEAPPTGEQEEI
jgi:ribose 5-phosphate isomerase B